jgi:hypothetical protein
MRVIQLRRVIVFSRGIHCGAVLDDFDRLMISRRKRPDPYKRSRPIKAFGKRWGGGFPERGGLKPNGACARTPGKLAMISAILPRGDQRL